MCNFYYGFAADIEDCKSNGPRWDLFATLEAREKQSMKFKRYK
jgi:hypothetical protein